MELTEVERATRDAAGLRDAGLSSAARRRAGIVHTAPQLARFAARAADVLLQRELGLARGLADPAVALIDPACGPGAFLAAALAETADRPSAPCAALGLDRDRAAIGAARAALAPAVARAGWPCSLRVCDTLTAMEPLVAARLGAVPVVLGNPPWIASAQAAPSPWLAALLEDFRRDAAGERLEERKLGVLSDAYVRFLRWACEVARHGERGAVVAFVTNASYLDGPVHRGMRAMLRRMFDSLHVLDLGGNALLARTAARDDNVFGVRPAAAVLIALRRPGASSRAPAPVRYLRLHGSANDKLERLATARLDDADWRTLHVDAGYERFVPTAATRDGYDRWPSLAQAMPFHREGVQTNRDAVAVDRERGRLLARLRAFAAGEARADLAAACAQAAHYDPTAARAAVARALSQDPKGTRGLVVRPFAYRPLDVRWFAAVAPLCHRPRPDLLAAMERSVFALISVRKDRGALPWAHFAAATAAPDNCLLSSRSSCRTRAFPTSDPLGRDNLALEIAHAYGDRIGRAIGAAEFARYALAVLACPAYRLRHVEALHVDYPRIPPPRTTGQFDALCAAGAGLLALFCEPLAGQAEAGRREDAGGEARDAAADAFAELDRHGGQVTLRGRPVCAASAQACDLVIGHHRVLRLLLRGSRADAAGLDRVRAACARADALARAICALDELYP
jgi:hypothetical protein